MISFLTILSIGIYDTFITNKDPRFYEKLMVRFELNTDGEVEEFGFYGPGICQSRLM